MDAARGVEPSVPSESEGAKFRRQQRVALVVMGLFLLGFAAVLAWRGIAAIEDQSLTITGEARRSVPRGPIGVREHDDLTSTWEGGEAVQAGAAFVCLYAMLVIAATLGFAVLWGGEPAFGCILGVLATLGVFCHAVYVYPPWRRWALERERSRA